jgi:Ca-activated chloride channel family protein
MRLLLPISVSLLLAWQAARAQTAEDFFNAQFYISNNIPSALEKVEGGLKIYPDDQELKKLEELLKQQQQQNQNQQNQPKQQQSQQNSNDQKNQQQNQQSPRKNSQDQQKPDEQKQNQSGEKKDEAQKKPEQQKSPGEKKGGEEKPDKQDAEGQPVAAAQMTPAEAKRLLDAQKGDEQVLQLKPHGNPEQNRSAIKDW